MVLALYVVAGVMVAGGLLAIYSGSDIIVMERGWTMVICGSVMAASGALLAGIATAVARLQAIEGEFARLADRLVSDRPDRPEVPTFSLPPDVEAEVVAPPVRRNLAKTKAPSPDRQPSPSVAAPSDVVGHRDLDITPEPVLRAPPVERPQATPAPPQAAEANDELFDRPEREAAGSGSALEPAQKAILPDQKEDEPAPPTVVGTYNSGGNFYIMYSDGSIEAETPAGKFRFDSLDELKDFIAAGGDRPKAAAPG